MTVAAPYGLIMRGYDPADDATVLLADMLHVDKIFVSQRTFTTTSYGGRSAVSYGYVDKDGFTDTYIILDLSDGGHGYVYLITQGDGMVNNADEINAIISSFDYGSASAETSAAQGGDLLTQQVDLGDDYVISMPDGWTSSSSDGSHTLVGTEFQLVVTTPTELAASGIDPSLGDVGTVLIDTVNAAGDYQIARADIQKTRYVGRAGAAFSSSDGRTEQMEVFVTLNDGLYGKVVVVTDIGGLVNYADLIDAMITSFHNTNNPDDAPVSSSGSTSVPESSGVACTVRTGSANSAQLRVGPGTNRGAISFLPVDTDVTVTGRIELDGGGVWYQLDKSQAAPDGTAAAELWVVSRVGGRQRRLRSRRGNLRAADHPARGCAAGQRRRCGRSQRSAEWRDRRSQCAAHDRQLDALHQRQRERILRGVRKRVVLVDRTLRLADGYVLRVYRQPRYVQLRAIRFHPHRRNEQLLRLVHPSMTTRTRRCASSLCRPPRCVVR